MNQAVVSTNVEKSRLTVEPDDQASNLDEIQSGQSTLGRSINMGSDSMFTTIIRRFASLANLIVSPAGVRKNRRMNAAGFSASARKVGAKNTRRAEVLSPISRTRIIELNEVDFKAYVDDLNKRRALQKEPKE